MVQFIQSQQAMQSNNIDQTFESALVLKEGQNWDLDIAKNMCEELCSSIELSYEYDDGPPENWIDLLNSQGERVGIVSIFVPAIFLLQGQYPKTVESFVCKKNITWMNFSDWNLPEHLVSSDLLSKIFSCDYHKELSVLEGKPISFNDFWVMTVT